LEISNTVFFTSFNLKSKNKKIIVVVGIGFFTPLFRIDPKKNSQRKFLAKLSGFLLAFANELSNFYRSYKECLNT